MSCGTPHIRYIRNGTSMFCFFSLKLSAIRLFFPSPCKAGPYYMILRRRERRSEAPMLTHLIFPYFFVAFIANFFFLVVLFLFLHIFVLFFPRGAERSTATRRS